jgi:DNA replication protein DnaC
MNNNQTLEKLKTMRLKGMADLHRQHIDNNLHTDLSVDEYLGILVDHEYEQRENNRIQRLFSKAHFRQAASIAGVTYGNGRNLDKTMFQRLANLGFIQKHENLIITGSSGVGKSFLGQSLGHEACQQGLSVGYHITSRLFNNLKLTKLDGTYSKELKRLEKLDLLILDDFGLQSLDNSDRETLMDIIDDRYDRKSTIVSSQIPVSSWYDLIGESTIADAILDRLVHCSHRIELKGESLRKQILSTK